MTRICEIVPDSVAFAICLEQIRNTLDKQVAEVSRANSALMADNIALQERVEQLQAALTSAEHHTQTDSVNQLPTMVRALGDKIE